MNQDRLTAIITEQTERVRWEAKNVINCVPDLLWDKLCCLARCCCEEINGYFGDISQKLRDYHSSDRFTAPELPT